MFIMCSFVPLQILGKFGKVLSVKDENALVIKACGLTLHCSKTSVVKVSLSKYICKIRHPVIVIEDTRTIYQSLQIKLTLCIKIVSNIKYQL